MISWPVIAALVLGGSILHAGAFLWLSWQMGIVQRWRLIALALWLVIGPVALYLGGLGMGGLAVAAAVAQIVQAVLLAIDARPTLRRWCALDADAQAERKRRTYATTSESIQRMARMEQQANTAVEEAINGSPRVRGAVDDYRSRGPESLRGR